MSFVPWARGLLYRNTVRVVQLSSFTLAVGGIQWAVFSSTYKPLPTPSGATTGIERSLDKLKELKNKIVPPHAHQEAKETLQARWTQFRDWLHEKFGVHLEKVPALRPIEDQPRSLGLGSATDTGSIGKPRHRIVFLGDSLVAGVGCEDGAYFPRRVARVLADTLNVDIEWVAFGKVGGNVQTLHETLIPKVKDLVKASDDSRPAKVDAVVVMCGLNDWKVALLNGQTPTDFRKKLESLAAVLHAEFGQDCHVVFPAIPVYWTTAFPQPMRAFVLKLCDVWDVQKEKLAAQSRLLRERMRIQSLVPGRAALEETDPEDGGAAASTPAGMIDFVTVPRITAETVRHRVSGIQASMLSHEGPGDDEIALSDLPFSLMAADGVHPNEDGYHIWADHIGNQLSTILKCDHRLSVADTGDLDDGEEKSV